MPNAVTWYPPNYYPIIVAGATWHWELPPFRHSGELATAGTLFDWTASPGRWLLEADMQDTSGKLIARFANSGTRDGDITGRADGILAFDMVAAETALLPITRDSTNSTDPRVAAYRHRGFLLLDLVVTDTTTSDIWSLAHGRVTVQQSTTT